MNIDDQKLLDLMKLLNACDEYLDAIDYSPGEDLGQRARGDAIIKMREIRFRLMGKESRKGF